MDGKVVLGMGFSLLHCLITLPDVFEGWTYDRVPAERPPGRERIMLWDWRAVDTHLFFDTFISMHRVL